MLDNAIPQGFEDAVELRRKNRETVVKYMNTKGQDRLRRHEPGAFMTTGGVARRLIDFANACVGHIRGGLAIAAVLACMLFAALSGSSPATVAAVGSIAIAGMVRSGYPQAFGAGIVCNAGTLGILIPPSIVMVVYAAATEIPGREAGIGQRPGHRQRRRGDLRRGEGPAPGEP